MTSIDNIKNAIENEEDPEKLASFFSDVVNNFSFPTTEVANAIYSMPMQSFSKFLHIASAWVEMLDNQNEEEWFDGRNEFSVKTGAAIAKIDALKNKLVPVEDWDKGFAQAMSRKHRTLQQSFSGLVFKVLDMLMMKDESFVADLKSAGLDEEYWWSMPCV